MSTDCRIVKTAALDLMQVDYNHMKEPCRRHNGAWKEPVAPCNCPATPPPAQGEWKERWSFLYSDGGEWGRELRMMKLTEELIISATSQAREEERERIKKMLNFKPFTISSDTEGYAEGFKKGWNMSHDFILSALDEGK